MKMTLRTSLELCRDLWQWLASSEKQAKVLWPRWHEVGLEYGSIARQCPCCQYAEDQKITTDGHNQYGCAYACPLGRLWPQGCMSHGSPYRDWVEATDRNDRKAAREAATKIWTCAQCILDRAFYHNS